MKVTKYPQSCLVVEEGDGRLLIDPGTLATAKHAVSDFGLVQAVLYTHQHEDHLDEKIVDELMAGGAKLYGNPDVAGKIGGGKVTPVLDGQRFEAAGFQITAHDLPHCKMTDGSDGPPNTGFLIDNVLFHPGDGIELEGLTSPAVALPIAGPSITLDNARDFALSLQAKQVVPIHYDYFKNDPEVFARMLPEAQVIILSDGESAEIG